MKTRLPRFVLALALIALPLFTYAAPPLDVPCVVDIRRDATGGGSATGTRVGFTGKLKSVDKDWICLDAGEEGEIWLPVSMIEYIRFGGPKT